MRLKKGDKVEVMNNKEDPFSWHVAEILSGNGHTYRVRYDSYPDMESEEMVETISRKFVRPRPPLVKGVENRIAGDIVEVFYEYAWRVATILRIINGKTEIRNKKTVQNRYSVRLHGCSQELIVDESNIRTRQTWRNDKCHVIANNPSTSLCYQKMNIQNKAAYRESRITSSRSLKRKSPYSSSIIEAHNGQAQKHRGIATPVLEKVENPGKKDVFPIISTRYNEMERREANSSSESEASSVGSCSDTDQNPNKNCIPFIPLSWQETDTVCSDAESCYPSDNERKSSSIPTKEELEDSIRRLEVHAYRRTLEALYASGPLSWEQEALLTNLRIMLHISNDEHLMEGQSWRHALFASKA